MFTLAVSLATGLFFGLTPLLQLGGQDLQEALKAAAGRNTATAGVKGFRQALVVGELALALMLLIGTGLMLRAFWKLQQVNVGVDPHGILTMRIALPQALYPDAKSVIGFWRNLSQRVSSLPGVTSASFASGLPPARQINANDTQIEGWVPREGGPIQNIDYYQTVGERYFETLRIPLIEGRTFDERDGESAPPVLVVNQTLARTYWPGQSAIGHRMKPGFTDPWRTVVGVVADVKNAAIDKPAGTELYIPYRQGFGLRNASLILKTPRDPESLASAARGEVRAVDAADVLRLRGEPSSGRRSARARWSAARAGAGRPRNATLAFWKCFHQITDRAISCRDDGSALTTGGVPLHAALQRRTLPHYHAASPAQPIMQARGCRKTSEEKPAQKHRVGWGAKPDFPNFPWQRCLDSEGAATRRTLPRLDGKHAYDQALAINRGWCRCDAKTAMSNESCHEDSYPSGRCLRRHVHISIPRLHAVRTPGHDRRGEKSHKQREHSDHRKRATSGGSSWLLVHH